MQHYYKRIFHTLLLVFCSLPSFSQQREIDSLKFSISFQSGTDRIQSLNELSWYYKNSNIDSAFIYSKLAIAEAKKLKDKKSILSAYNALANVFDGNGQLDSAEYFHKQSLALGYELADSSNIASSLNNLGIVYDLKGENDNALEMYFQALAIYESLNTDNYSIAMTLGNIGVVYKKQKQYSSALEFYERALAIYKKENSAFGIMVTQGNIGSVLIPLKRYKESIISSEIALDAYSRAGYLRYIPYVEHNLAIANDSLGNFTLCQSLYESAIRKHEIAQNYNELALTRISFCDFLYRQKRFNEGIKIAHKASENAAAANAIEAQIDALKYLAKFNSALGNYRKAFLLLEKYEFKKDSLLVENNMKQTLELQTKYKTALQEKKLLKQKVELAKKVKAIQLQIAFIILLFLLILWIIWRFKVKRQQQKIIADLEMNKERNRIAMDLHDHVGAELTLASSKIDVLAYKEKRANKIDELQKIANQIRNINATLRETVWSIQNETITVQELLNRVETYVQKLFNGQLDYSSNSNAYEYKLSPQVALNLYRICQEGCTNCFKYADASTLNLSVAISKNRLKLMLKDNGIGFNQSVITSGYGLINMKQRVEKINGQMEILSSFGKGAEIRVDIYLH